MTPIDAPLALRFRASALVVFVALAVAPPLTAQAAPAVASAAAEASAPPALLDRLAAGSAPFDGSAETVARALRPLALSDESPAVFWAAADYADPGSFFPDPAIRAILQVGFFRSDLSFAEELDPSPRGGPVHSAAFYFLGSPADRARSRLFAVDLSIAAGAGDADIAFSAAMSRLTRSLGARPTDLRIGYDYGATGERRNVGMAAWRAGGTIALLLMASSPVTGAIDDEQLVLIDASRWKEYGRLVAAADGER